MKCKLWALIDKDEDVAQQLHEALAGGGLYLTKPIPAYRWLKAVRVTVTINVVAPPETPRARTE